MGLGILDYILLITSVAFSAFIGIYFTHQNKSMSAYMLGDRRMSLLPVGVSLMTSCLSGLAILGSSAELYYQGPSYSFVFIPILLAGPITAYTILPVFHRMNTLSLYEYLHKRYGLAVKYIVTVVYILQMIFYNAVVLYLPSMATSGVFGISRIYSILVIGFTCVLYSGIGGMKAVVWSDLFQAICMFLALLVVGLLGTYDAGGISQVIRLAAENGRTNLDSFLNFDLTTRHTLFGILTGSILKNIYIVGVNQVQIQRALSLPTLRQGQLSFLWCSFFAALVIILSTYLGAVLVAAYRSCDPFLGNEVPRRDAVLVHYVARRLAVIPGLRGIFIAGIFSATLSTLSSFANSMAALALEDFVKPLAKLTNCHKLVSNDQSRTRLAKVIAILFGIICVMMAYVIEKANSRLLQLTTTMFGAIGVPFLISFGFGIFTRFANTWGVLAGFLVTLSLGSYITIYQTFFALPLIPLMPVYYDDKCAMLFNSTIGPEQMPPLLDSPIEWSPETGFLPQSYTSFSLDQISYLVLPAVQMCIMIIVTTFVSLLTGGWSQQVNDDLLVTFMQSESNKTSEPSIQGRSYIHDYDETGDRVYYLKTDILHGKVDNRFCKTGSKVTDDQL